MEVVTFIPSVGGKEISTSRTLTNFALLGSKPEIFIFILSNNFLYSGPAKS
jgi:hypothetical protein